MPHIVFSPASVRDLERLRQFLAPKSPLASRRAMQTIRSHLMVLASTPEIGRPSSIPGVRELLIPFGDGGYVARYGHASARDEVYILRIWHQREAGY